MIVHSGSILVVLTMASMKTVFADISDVPEIQQDCLGGLSIIENNTVIHKIRDTDLDIIISLSKQQKVEVRQTGNCCHHVFSDKKCRGKGVIILDNINHRIKHTGHMSVIKSAMKNGTCRSIGQLKALDKCQIQDKERKQIQKDDVTDSNRDSTPAQDISGNPKSEDKGVSAIAKTEEDNVSVIANPEENDASTNTRPDDNDVSSENKDNDVSSENTDNEVSSENTDNDVSSENTDNDVSSENTNNKSLSVTSPVESQSKTSSITVICVLVVIVIIFAVIFGIFCKKDRMLSCFHGGINGKNNWTPVSNDDFTVEMDDTDSDVRDTCIVKTETIFNKEDVVVV